MILETLRIVTDWMNHPVHGLNAQLPGIARDAGDPQPPLVLTIVDPTRDKRCAKFDTPVNLPAVYVHLDGPVTGQGEIPTVFRDFDSASLGIRYLVRNPDTEEAARDTLYTLRAIVRSLRELLKDANADSRNRNGVYIQTATRLDYGPWQEAVGDATATGVVVFTLNVRDKTP
jgi:hypothetical protein